MATTQNAQPSCQSRQSRQSSIDRAYTRAIQMARAGIVPALVRSSTSADGLQTVAVFGVPSRTAPGAVHLVTLIADCDGLASTCDCPAGATDKPCWHRAACRLQALGELPEPVNQPDAWMLSGKPAPVELADFVNVTALAV